MGFGRYLCALSLCLAVATPARPQAPSSRTSVAKKVLPGVVYIARKGDGAKGFGSGFLVSADGRIMTALHVIAGNNALAVTLPNGDVYDNVSVLAYDEKKDIAIIRIAGFDLPTVELGNSSQVAPGDSVLLVGNPEGLRGTLTAGIVSSVRDSLDGNGYRVIQTDAAVNPGNSGGPLIDGSGRAIGILTSKLRDSANLGFAIPINYARGLMQNAGAPMTLAQFAKATSAPAQPPAPSREVASGGANSTLANEVINSITVEDLKEIVRANNYVISDKKADGGFIFVMEGLKVLATVNENNKAICFSLYLSNETTLEKVNAYNRKAVYGFGWLTKENNPVLQLDLFVGSGVTRRTVSTYLKYFPSMIGDFKAALGYTS